jgi:hypothetical protein
MSVFATQSQLKISDKEISYGNYWNDHYWIYHWTRRPVYQTWKRQHGIYFDHRSGNCRWPLSYLLSCNYFLRKIKLIKGA